MVMAKDFEIKLRDLSSVPPEEIEAELKRRFIKVTKRIQELEEASKVTQKFLRTEITI